MVHGKKRLKNTASIYCTLLTFPLRIGQIVILVKSSDSIPLQGWPCKLGRQKDSAYYCWTVYRCRTVLLSQSWD